MPANGRWDLTQSLKGYNISVYGYVAAYISVSLLVCVHCTVQK
jgi:hypothetical protein